MDGVTGHVKPDHPFEYFPQDLDKISYVSFIFRLYLQFKRSALARISQFHKKRLRIFHYVAVIPIRYVKSRNKIFELLLD